MAARRRHELSPSAVNVRGRTPARVTYAADAPAHSPARHCLRFRLAMHPRHTWSAAWADVADQAAEVPKATGRHVGTSYYLLG